MKHITKNEIFLLEELVKKEFSSKYKDSVLGILWTLLRPLLMMIILTIIFSTIFGGGITNYPIYFLCGRCMFDFFNGGNGAAMNSLKGNKNILQRTAAPKYIFVFGGIISEILNFMITIIVLIFVMIVTHCPFYLTMPLSIIPIIALLLIFQKQIMKISLGGGIK